MKRVLALLLSVLMIVSVLGVSVSAAPSIRGQIAVVMDYETGEVLYQRRAHDRWIPASMTKTLTAFIAYQEIEAGNITMETMAPVSAFASQIAGGGHGVQGNHVAMRAGSYVSVEDLIRLNMLPSSNGASVVLAELISGSEAAFVDRMHQTAWELDMYVDFNNSHGALVQHSNAYSIAVLTREFIRRFPQILEITSQPFMYFDGRRQNNTNLLVRPDSAYYRASVDGFKTGIITQSGWGHSVTEYRDGRRIIAVVMNSNDNTGRHRDALALLDFGFAELERRIQLRNLELAVTPQLAEIRVILDGEYMEFDVPPMMIGNRTMVPFRAIFEAFGMEVDWDEENQSIGAKKTEVHRTEITLQIGNDSMFVETFYLWIGMPDYEPRPAVYSSTNQIFIDIPPIIVDNRTLVPLRAISEALNATVDWDDYTRTVTIESAEVVSSADDAGNDENDIGNAGSDDILSDILGVGDDEESITLFNARYSFEQRILPEFIFNNENAITNMLLSGDILAAEAVILEAWEATTEGYDFYEHILGVTIERIDDETTAIIVEMRYTGFTLLSSYIAIAYNETLGLQYFTLERGLDFITNEVVYMFCFVDTVSRGSIFLIENNREYFFEAIRRTMSTEE